MPPRVGIQTAIHNVQKLDAPRNLRRRQGKRTHGQGAESAQVSSGLQKSGENLHQDDTIGTHNGSLGMLVSPAFTSVSTESADTNEKDDLSDKEACRRRQGLKHLCRWLQHNGTKEARGSLAKVESGDHLLLGEAENHYHFVLPSCKGRNPRIKNNIMISKDAA